MTRLLSAILLCLIGLSPVAGAYGFVCEHSDGSRITNWPVMAGGCHQEPAAECDPLAGNLPASCCDTPLRDTKLHTSTTTGRIVNIVPPLFASCVYISIPDVTNAILRARTIVAAEHACTENAPLCALSTIILLV